MNVLIIPEDFRKDQYILKPLLKRMFVEVGKPHANVQMCLDPLMGGVDEALKWERIREVLTMYPMVNLFLLIVDRDGKAGRRMALDNLESKAAEHLGTTGRQLFAENAWQEIEVWAIAGQSLPKDWKWAEIRQHPHPKEAYFEPLAMSRKLMNEPGEGRYNPRERGRIELLASTLSVPGRYPTTGRAAEDGAGWRLMGQPTLWKKWLRGELQRAGSPSNRSSLKAGLPRSPPTNDKHPVGACASTGCCV